MRVADGFRDLTGGVSSGLLPSLIAANQSADLVNAIVRGGFATNRPPYQPVTRTGQVVTVGGSAVVQALASYVPVDGTTPYYFALVGGRLYRITLMGVVTEETLAGDPNSSTLPQAWMTQGEQYMFVQDGQSRPLIYDGATWRRARKSEPPFWDMPTGTAMEYAFGRMYVARGVTWVAGDIRGGGTEIYQFTENAEVAIGGSWTVPISGRITAMRVMAALDNSIGQGPLTIHTPNGICTARVDQPRTAWKDIQFQQTAVLPSGSLSQNSTVIINGDMWYRAFDGWHSFVLARRQFQQWGNVPQSFEMAGVLAFDDPKMLRYSQAVLFNDRMVGTSWPHPYMSGGYHSAMVGLDFAALGSISNQLPPAWDGVFTGINPEVMAKVKVGNKERLFMLSRNMVTNQNELWEMLQTGAFDNGDGRIVWSMDSRAMPFGDDLKAKRLLAGELFIDDVKGQVDFVVQFKPDQYPCWFDWTSFGVCNNYKACTVTCGPVKNLQPGFRPHLVLPAPPEGVCQQGGDIPSVRGYEFQVRIVVTGHCRIRKFIMQADTVEETPMVPNVCEPTE